MSRILIGSRYFFSCYPDFTSKDIDELELIETDEFHHVRQITGQGRCLFLVKRQTSKEEYIDWELQNGLGMAIGKFLIPEFCEEIGFTIEDLPRLAPLLDKLDATHKYERTIFYSYLKNGSFTLTDEQRAQAYKSYKKSRGK